MGRIWYKCYVISVTSAIHIVDSDHMKAYYKAQHECQMKVWSIDWRRKRVMGACSPLLHATPSHLLLWSLRPLSDPITGSMGQK